MAWTDLPAVERALRDALDSFDWLRAESLVSMLVGRVRAEPDPFPTASMKRILRRLRRKRRFLEIQQVADALSASGQDSALLRRHHAQALIDNNLLSRAREVLATIVADPAERTEALGLLGRIEKQQYVAVSLAGGRGDPACLQRALALYLGVYRENPKANLWHGINAAALLARAAKDGVPAPGTPSPEVIAHEILATIQGAEEGSDQELPAWSVATALEAQVALGNVAEAEQRALEYAGCCDADAFEVFSTLRQMRGVWLLRDDDSDPVGSRVLPVLHAALLRRQGGEIRVAPKDTTRQLEKTFGTDRFQTLSWYQEGLARCRGVARMERIDGRGFGTGWLVDSREFFPAAPGRALVLTNAHVVCPEEFEGALDPADARAAFQVLGARFEVRAVVWCSKELDACFLELNAAPDAEPLPLYTRRVHMANPPSRVYIIGHPGGGDLEFSLQDSHLVGCDARLLHYRTPTDYGSSGSPVFEALGWRVAALHHAGGHHVPSLSAPEETYAANEGITIACLREATASVPPR